MKTGVQSPFAAQPSPGTGGGSSGMARLGDVPGQPHPVEAGRSAQAPTLADSKMHTEQRQINPRRG